ncbi:hypothetical protein [Vibrio zhanjiangensis]|uniref:hypothetical protein n=1 Tax=Vibrio zhanjiangensis TaxID=1046128 RepID=UPI0024E0A4EF|nr:hypothetical protein [Vibrio zhanjiangensis]
MNENDLRRALNQPIRKDYYFDVRGLGANQARFFNPYPPVEEEPTLDVAEPEFKDKIRHYNQILPEHREPNITLETGSSDESDSARQLIHSFCNEPDGFQLGLPKLLNLIDSGRFSEGVSNLVREWVAEYQTGYGIDRNILEKVLKDKGYAGLADHAIVVSDDQGSIYVSSLDKIMASTRLRSGYLSGYTDRTGAISKEELTDIIEQYQSMSRLIGSTYEHFRSHTDRTSASVQLYRDPIEYISEGAIWPNLNTFSAVLDPDDERAFKSTLQKMGALEQALRLLYKEILGIEPPYKLGVESREDLAQQLDSFGESGSEFVDEHPEYLNYRLTWRKIEALGGDIADYLALSSHLNWPMAEDGISEDATELASSYRSMSADAKQELYSNAVEYVLFQIGRDKLLSQGTRGAAYNARLKNEPCVVVDSTKPNSFFLPDSPGAKSGLYIDLNKPGQPYQRKANFTYQPSDLVSLNTLSRQLVTITDSYANNDEEVADLISHVLPKSILGAQVPELGVSAEQVQLELEYTFATSSFSEYLRSISRPFASLARQTQLMIDDGNGVTLQQTEKNQQQAEYIGAWIDAGIGVVTSFTPQGAVLNAAQSWAGIAADVVDGKDPDPVDLAGAILGSIPGSRAGAQIGKFSKTGGQGVKVLLKVGEETVDLIDLGRGVKQACDSGDPLDLFSVLLSTGMKAQDVIERAHQIKPDLADADIPKQNQWLIENGVDNGWGSSRPPLGVEGNSPVPGTTGRSLYGQAVPIRRPELHGGEWAGQSGTLPGTDADYFAYIDAGGTPEEYYATLKEAEPAVTQSLFSFFGKQYQGRVQDGQFEIKKVGSDEWRAGHWWEEFTWRFKNRGGRVQSSAELDKRILKAVAKNSDFNQICYKSAINTAQASGELPKGVAESLRSASGSGLNSLIYNEAFSLPTSVTESPGSSLVERPLSKGDITESGFIHVGTKDGDGNVHYEHVIYAYVQNGEVTLYQSNSPTFYAAFGGDIQQPSNNQVGQSSLTKIEWSEKTDTKLAEEQGRRPNLVYSFTPTNQVKNVADISVQQNGDVEVSAGEQKEVFSVGNNAQEIARIPFMNEGRRVEVRGYTSEFQGRAGQEALSIHGDRQGNFYLARQSHPMTAQQLVDYLKSQGVDLKSGSGPVHLLSCYSKSSGAAQALADVINRPVIGYSNRGIQLPTLQQLTQNPVQIGSKMGKFDPRRFLTQSDFKPATPRVYHPRSDSSQGASTSGRASLEKAGSGSGSNAKQMAFNALPQMQASPSWYSAENIYTPRTSAHGVIFNDPDNPDRLIKFYKRPSDKGIAENNRDVMNKLYSQDAELITLTDLEGQSYYAVNMPKMKGVSIEDIKDPQVMQDMLEKIEDGDFIAHWAGKLQDNGIRVEDLNLGSVLYDPSSGRFSLVDFDSSTISDSVSNAHYKQMYRSLHTPIRDVLIKQAKTLFAGQQDKLDLVNRVEGKLSQRFRHLMELDERGEASFSTLMEERTPADVEVAVGARNQEAASAGHADEPIQLSKGDWDSIPNKVEMFGEDSEYFYEDFDGQIYKYETADGEITYLGKQDGEYIDLKNDQTWQPRRYSVVGPNAIKTWLTGDPATLYADTDKVIADRSASYDNERLENIRNGFDQGHYLPPIDVRWDNGVFKVINGNHRLKVAREMGMESIPYRLIR